MTLEEIKEGNNLCAKFLNWKNLNDDSFPEYLDNNYNFIPDGKLEFHSNWNWLMEVVEKIRDYRNNSTSDTTCGTLKEEVYHVVGRARIDLSFKTVVQFIKWYNKNNK